MNSDRQQHTTATPVRIEGIGLHTGKPVQMEFLPADAGTGIVFVRTDLAGEPLIRADLANVVSTNLAP